MNLLIAPLEALTDDLLSDPERRVLLSLFSFRGKVTNTVWPSVELIAERSNIKDHTRVSKITTSLAAKGWLSKRKRGFTGCNKYELTVPSRLDSGANLDSGAILDTDANSNLDSNASSNLVSGAKYKEQTNEQTNEELKPIPGKAISKSKFTKPSLEELITEFYGKVIHPEVEANKFLNHYESVGWKVGKNAMKSWKHSVAGWAARSKENANTSQRTQHGFQQAGSPPKLSTVDRNGRAAAEYREKLRERAANL